MNALKQFAMRRQSRYVRTACTNIAHALHLQQCDISTNTQQIAHSLIDMPECVQFPLMPGALNSNILGKAPKGARQTFHPQEGQPGQPYRLTSMAATDKSTPCSANLSLPILTLKSCAIPVVEESQLHPAYSAADSCHAYSAADSCHAYS